MTGDRADRELLFEALAVHLGFLGQDTHRDLNRARRDDAALGARPIGQVLVEGAVLTGDQRAFLDMAVGGLLDRHQGDLGRCLDALSGFAPLRHDLERRRARAAAVLGASTNPTLPSIPIDDRSGSGPDAGDDDSFLPGASDLLAGDGPAGPRVEWTLGGSTSEGVRFRILRPHAQGGIGKVSVALDAELQREVALKQIKPERADDTESRARFLLEAEVTGRLEHPGIVPVYGLGIDESGRPFYAMRFVRGISFEEAIRQFHQADDQPRRDPQERMRGLRHLLDRFVDICQTVAYAHSRGVLHRDLKPANVLLGPFNESLVVDWGLAKVFARAPGEPPGPDPDAEPGPESRAKLAPDAEGTEALGAENGESSPETPPPIGLSSSTETAAGTAFGTPAYMSPEQAEGRVNQLGPASDVYSLGAMLYTLLSGHAPFEYVWCDVTALLDRVRLGEFPPPRQVNPRVPRALEAVCLKAMAQQSGDRYASASGLADEIDRWLSDDPVSAYREPAPARLARWGRRHKPVVAGAAALLLTAVVALSAGVILVGREQQRTEQQRRLADEQRVVALSKSIEATQKADQLRLRDAISRVNLACREYLDDNVALADRLLEGCPTDLRSWEWSYAHRLGHSELRTWTGSSGGRDVWCVAFSPDGSRIAAGSGPWFQVRDRPDRRAGRPRDQKQCGGFRDPRTDGRSPGRGVRARRALDRGGPWIRGPGAGLRPDATRCRERQADLAGQRAEHPRPGPRLRTGWTHDRRGLRPFQLVQLGRFRPAPRCAARVRFAASRSPAHPGGVLSVSYAPDGRQIALASRDVVDLWDVAGAGASLIHQLRGHVNFVYAVAFSPDGRRLATGGWDKTIQIWDRATGKRLDTLNGHRGFVRSLAFSSDGSQLVSGSEDKSVRRWDLAGNGGDAAFHGHDGFVHGVAFSPDGALAASGSQDGTVKLWPAAAPDSQVTFRNSAGWVGTLAFAPDGRRIASAHDGSVRIWDPRTGEELHRLIAPRGLLARIALAFAPDGASLVASGPGGALNLWDTKSWERRPLEGHHTPANDAAFSRTGSTLATSHDDGTDSTLGRRPAARSSARSPATPAAPRPWPSPSTEIASPRPERTRRSGSGTSRPANRGPR